jgi:branched-chain amino acid transport system permease protein
MKTTRTSAVVGGSLVLAGLVVLPLTGIQSYWIYTLTIGFYYALLAASWSLLVGYVGRISFAQAAMSGLGAYTSALSLQHFGWPLPVSLVAGVLLAGLVGVFIGWLTLRLHGAYLGLTTIAFSEILRITVTAEHGLTAGSLGLRVPPLIQGGSPLTYYYLFLGVTIVCLALMLLLLQSRIGLFFQAIREDEDGAASLGVEVTTWKVMAFATSSAFAGLAGGLYAHFVQLITPSMMSLQEMGFVLAMAVIGGFHNVVYAALGGLLLQLSLEGLREVGEWRLVVFGLAAILVLRFAPNGLFGSIFEAFNRKGLRR